MFRVHRLLCTVTTECDGEGIQGANDLFLAMRRVCHRVYAIDGFATYPRGPAMAGPAIPPRRPGGPRRLDRLSAISRR